MKLITADTFPKVLLYFIIGIWVSIILVNHYAVKTDPIITKVIKRQIEQKDSLINILEVRNQQYYKDIDSLKSQQKIIEVKTNTIKNFYHEKLDTIYRVPISPREADSILSVWINKDKSGYYNLPRQ
jgi:hypothetical protein